MKEEKCIILDFLPSGYADRRHSEPIAQAIGCDFFSLLEVVPKENITLNQEEEVYISEDKRNKIRFIKGQISYKNLTSIAKNLLPDAVEKIIRTNEKKYVEFFNKARTITPRLHKFQLLPGVGKKHLSNILEERRKKQFKSFDDIAKRVKMFPDPVKTLVRRVLEELEGNEKYCLFVAPPRRSFR